MAVYIRKKWDTINYLLKLLSTINLQPTSSREIQSILITSLHLTPCHLKWKNQILKNKSCCVVADSPGSSVEARKVFWVSFKCVLRSTVSSWCSCVIHRLLFVHENFSPSSLCSPLTMTDHSSTGKLFFSTPAPALLCSWSFLRTLMQ